MNEGVARLLVMTALSSCAPGPPLSPRERLERSLEAMEISRQSGPEEGLLFEALGTLNQGVENQGRSPAGMHRTAHLFSSC